MNIKAVGAATIVLEQRTYDVGDALFRRRVLESFDQSATRYPIHRVVRCAARRYYQEIFDDLALKVGLSAQRLDIGSLLLDGPGALVRAEGAWKSEYSSCVFSLWAHSEARANEVRESLLTVVGDLFPTEQMFVVDWYFRNSSNELTSYSFEEMREDEILDEAYPVLRGTVDDFIARYLRSKETVLVLLGPPGTGKTRLVRALLSALSARKKQSAQIMYTSDKTALENDEIFVDFVTGAHDAFVIEDADHLLKARSNGNEHLHRFLSIADGVVRAQGRKIVFTTSLPNIRELDEALLRPGRCFAVVRTGPLAGLDVDRVLERLTGKDAGLFSAAQSRLIACGERAFTLAKLYQAVNEARDQRSNESGEAAEGGVALLL